MASYLCDKFAFFPPPFLHDNVIYFVKLLSSIREKFSRRFLALQKLFENFLFFLCVPFESLTHLLYCSVRNEKKIYGLLKLWVRYNLILLNLILNEIFFILSIVCSWINVIFIHFTSHKWHLRFIIGNNGGILKIFWGTQRMYLSYDEQKNFKLNSAHMCV